MMVVYVLVDCVVDLSVASASWVIYVSVMLVFGVV
jgi:hypothetical protein